MRRRHTQQEPWNALAELREGQRDDCFAHLDVVGLTHALATNCLPTWSVIARLTAIAFLAPEPPGGLPAPGDEQVLLGVSVETCIRSRAGIGGTNHVATALVPKRIVSSSRSRARLLGDTGPGQRA
jgi:hypothetical protein